MKKYLIPIGIISCCYGISVDCYAQTKIIYSRKEGMIPMRDGKKLFTVIYTPQNVTERLPIIIVRTPYGSKERAQDPVTEDYVNDMAAEGYIFVTQDVRGRYDSEGFFEMSKPITDLPGLVDESTDTYDTVEWLIHNVSNNNGKVGQLGISYMGWTTLCAAARPHPAMKAASEQACSSDLFLGDDFHHNGAFRLAYAFDVSYMIESSKINTFFPFSHYDQYNWFLQLGPLSNVNKKYFFNKMPSWNNFMHHPNYDSFWKYASPLRYVGYPRIPMLHVGGVWDQEDMNGPQLMYKAMEQLDSNKRNYICLGPWNHGQWAYPDSGKLGAYQMGKSTTEYFQKNIQKKWFDYWLKGKGDGNFAEATVFETGTNEWKTYESWPPKNAIPEKLYIQGDGKLSFKKCLSTDATAYDEFISDPAKPVPYRSRPIEQTYSTGSRWNTWLVEDQRFADGRPDVLTWQSDSVTDDITITGNVIAHLFASTTGSDADWVVKLIDVYPDHYYPKNDMSGYQLMIASEVLRGRFRNSFEKPTPITSNKVLEYTIDMHQVSHTFLKGHRIMIQIQSSWFPIIDMNPQKYVPSIYDAKASDYKKATQRIFRNSKYATYIEFPKIK